MADAEHATTAAVSVAPRPQGVDPKAARRTFASSVVGTTIEFYDFTLFGLASVLVFAPQFFPPENALAAQLGALATFAVGFMVRPIGGVIAGHWGDRVGRKPVLITSFLTMGLVTFAIAFLPTYETIGVAAPIILVVLRVLQGLAAGAEWGGAALMAVEHAGTGKRGLYGSAPSFGTTLGSLLSTSVMVIVSRANPEAFATFGWRIAFGLSAILVVIGLFIRRRVSETPAFEQAVKSQRQRVPFLALLRYHPLALLRGLSWILISAALGYSISPYSVGWAVEHHGLNRDFLLITTMVGLVFMLVCQTAASRLLDGARRRTVLIASLAFTTVVAALFFPLVATGAPVVIVVAYCLGYAGVGILQVANGSVLADEFPANVAYTGVSLSYNFAYALAGLLPLISVSLIAATGSIAGHVVILVAIALLAFPVALRTPRAGASVSERPVLKPELGQMATDK